MLIVEEPLAVRREVGVVAREKMSVVWAKGASLAAWSSKDDGGKRALAGWWWWGQTEF